MGLTLVSAWGRLLPNAGSTFWTGLLLMWWQRVLGFWLAAAVFKAWGHSISQRFLAMFALGGLVTQSEKRGLNVAPFVLW